MPDEFNPIPGSYMDRVDKAGGIESYQLEQAKKFMESISEVEPEQWKRLTETLSKVKAFIDVDSSVFGTMKDSIVDTIILKKDEIFAPITNEINELINTALEPILPAIEWLVNNVIVPIIQGIADAVTFIFNFLGAGDFVIEHPDIPGTPGDTNPRILPNERVPYGHDPSWFKTPTTNTYSDSIDEDYYGRTW